MNVMHEQTAYAGPVLRCIRGSNLEGNLAVALGWMTQEQLREALVEQAHLSSAGIVPTLDGILLSGYLITEDQAATLSRLNHAAYAMQDVYRIGAIALRAGWIRRDQLRAALARHRETPGGEAAGFFAECAGLSEDGVRAACEVQSRIVREKERRGVSHAVAEMPLEERTSWRIGRAAGCEILIDDSEVSKVHARIFRRAGQWFVEDLGNRIGTLLDGRRLLGTAPFGRGSVIVVGSAVVCLAEPARPKAPAARYLREERRPSGEGEYRFAAATFLSIATAVSALVATWQEPPPPAAGRVGASTLAAPTPEPRREAAPAPAVAGTAPAGKDPVRETPRAEPAPAAEMPPAEGPAPEFPVAAATPPAAIPSPDPPAPRDEEPLQPALFAHRARVGVTEAARRDAIDELLAREADWRAEALAILLEWRGVTMKNLVRTADRRAWARLVDLRRQLFELRLAAVTAIQSKNYTEREGQEEVDRRVQAVRDFLGKYGGLRIAPISAGQRELLARIEWIDSRLAGLGVRPQTVPSSITLRRDAPVDFDRLRLDWEPGTTAEQDDATLAWNRKQRTLVSEVEWDAAEALNDYRALLGRPLLRLDEGLCQAARTHAEYMSKRGRLVHVEPDPALAGPWARATHFGFECDREGIGENIVPGRSTGRAAFEAFYRSAPHHRNMIRMHHRSLGTGQAGGWWTWDFGRSKTG